MCIRDRCNLVPRRNYQRTTAVRNHQVAEPDTAALTAKVMIFRLSDMGTTLACGRGAGIPVRVSKSSEIRSVELAAGGAACNGPSISRDETTVSRNWGGSFRRASTVISAASKALAV